MENTMIFKNKRAQLQKTVDEWRKMWYDINRKQNKNQMKLAGNQAVAFPKE